MLDILEIIGWILLAAVIFEIGFRFERWNRKKLEEFKRKHGL